MSRHGVLYFSLHHHHHPQPRHEREPPFPSATEGVFRHTGAGTVPYSNGSKSTILRHIAHAEGDDTLHSRVRRGEVARMATKAPFSLVIPPLNKDSKAAPLQAKNTRNPPQTLKSLGVWRDLGAEPLTLVRG